MDHRIDRRDRLIEAGLTLSSELSLEGVLQRIVELAVEVTGARYGALGVIGAEGRLIEFLTTGVSDAERERIGHPPEGHGILGALIREGGALRIPDIAADPRSVGFPPNHPPMRSFLGMPIRSRDEIFGNIYLTEKQGAPGFTPEDERDLSVLAAQAGVAVENARLYREAQRRRRWLEAVREIATSILSGAPPEQALEIIADRALELVGAEIATVAVPEASTGRLTLRVARGVGADTLRGMSFPIKGSISGEVVAKGEAIAVEDASSDPRAYQPVVAVGGFGPSIFVPLMAHGSAFGTLMAANQVGGRSFEPGDAGLLQTFADQASLALEYGRAQQENQRLMVLEDRERIAKELHDGVIQALFAVGMGLQGTALMSQDEELAERIESAVGELDRVIRDLRNYIFGLRPGILADRQLDQALRALGEEFQQKSGVVTVVEVDSTVASELSSHASDLLQLARESLSNVGRHAEASTCRLSLYRNGQGAILEVDDDGRGFDPATVRRGDGLSNMEERIDTLGGELSIDSSPAEGTTVRLFLPF
ncbi:MAG TPA: GAF domain-containing sensor histidine kinase [Actinomycetota bacterium]|nr:GAF domain-containing sensor histidine kinase [Actinomycetota bacterium]